MRSRSEENRRELYARRFATRLGFAYGPSGKASLAEAKHRRPRAILSRLAWAQPACCPWKPRVSNSAPPMVERLTSRLRPLVFAPFRLASQTAVPNGPNDLPTPQRRSDSVHAAPGSSHLNAGTGPRYATLRLRRVGSCVCDQTPGSRSALLITLAPAGCLPRECCAASRRLTCRASHGGDARLSDAPCLQHRQGYVSEPARRASDVPALIGEHTRDPTATSFAPTSPLPMDARWRLAKVRDARRSA